MDGTDCRRSCCVPKLSPASPHHRSHRKHSVSPKPPSSGHHHRQQHRHSRDHSSSSCSPIEKTLGRCKKESSAIAVICDKDEQLIPTPTLDADLILRHLRCVRCSVAMIPPLPQCKRGHLICLDCRRQVSLCPTCHGAFSGERNMAMEVVAEVVPYPCKFSATGCPSRVPLSNKKAHEETCSFQPLPCPICDGVVTGLSKGLFNHLEEIHSKRPKMKNPFKISLQMPTLRDLVKKHTDFKDAIVLDIDGAAYVFSSHFLSSSDEWIFLVQQFEPKGTVEHQKARKNKSTFSYELRLEKPEGSKLTYSNVVVPATDRIDSVLSKGGCLRISSEYFFESFSGGVMIVHVKKD